MNISSVVCAPPVVPLVATLIFVGSITSASSAVTINATESGGDVVLTFSGSLELAAWTYDSSIHATSEIQPAMYITVGPPYVDSVDVYLAPTDFGGPLSFGLGSTSMLADTGSGDYVGLVFDPVPWGSEALAVPAGYSSGSFLSGSSTYAGESFASLGLTPSTYAWVWGAGASADSITLIIPEPSALTLLGLGSLSLVMVRRRR